MSNKLPLLFPASELESALAEGLEHMPEPGRWSAINAMWHLNRSWKTRDIDPEMAAFRALTSEEEAATALLRALVRLGYSGADRLNAWLHIHKNAVIPMLDAVSRLLAVTLANAPTVELEFNPKERPPRLRTRIHLPNPLTGEKALAYPVPPLNLTILGGKLGEPRVRLDFAEQLQIVVKESGHGSFKKLLGERANQRNLLLYAADNGVRRIEKFGEPEFNHYKRNAFTILQMYYLIEPWEERQDLVQQVLDALLNVLPRMRPEGGRKRIEAP